MAFTLRSHVSYLITARMLRAVCILSLLSVLSYISLCALVSPVYAADAPAPVSTPNAAMAPAAPFGKSEVRPLWAELTPAQQQVLGPLATQWSQLDSNHKSKWIAISNKYRTMTPEQQQRLNTNISEWAKLTPEQHRLARESYAKAKKLNPEQKNAQWQQYQQLPEEQKKKLAADAAEKKRIANVPSLQSKPKTVEPLKAGKKQVATAGPVPASTPVATPGAPVRLAVPATQSGPAASAPVSHPSAPVGPTPAINK